MDSANSGSIQSSSGADEEYDSRAAADSSSFAAFLTNNHHPPPPQNNHMLFQLDPLSNYLDPRPNLDMLWSKPPRSEPNPSDLPHNQAFLLSQLATQPTPVNVHAFHTETASLGGSLISVTTANDTVQPHANSNTTTTATAINNNNNNTVRNPKKRSRASRRAPTTVLTTDTTNFRAMVQEFTGIPAPPFTSSPFSRPRLDLFGSGSTSSLRSSPLDAPPPYLLRPFAQKLHPFPPSSSTPLVNSNNNSTSINYPLNIHNQILSFQSNNILPISAQQSSLEIPPTVDSHLKMSGLDELGLSHHAHANNTSLHQNDVVPNSSNNNNDGGVLRNLNGALNYRNKVNYTASPSDFHGEKSPECAVAARSEGMMESWINCSSD